VRAAWLLPAAALAMALGGGAASPARHLFLLPVAWIAVARGRTPGVLAGLTAGLLQAPMVLPLIEAEGFGPRAADATVAMLLPLAAGLLLGGMADELRGRASMLRALLAIQQALASAGAAGVDAQLGQVAQHVRRALGASRAGIVLRADGQAPTAASAPPGAELHLGSAAAWAAEAGTSLEVRDLETDGRFPPGEVEGTPCRGLILPLRADERVLGTLALETHGDLRPGARMAAEEIAMHLALAIENTRLGTLRRRFAEELEAAVASATRSLRELDQAKSEFVSVVSHELRTPLTALVGFAELLLTREVPAERARRCLAHMHGEAQRLARIVGDLLDLSRIESGATLELAGRAPVDLGAVVERNVDLFAAAHPRHGFAARVQAERPVIVAADPDAIDRVIKNLLSNAVKYSPAGGRVTVSVSAAPVSPMVEIAVEDEGVGIPPEALARIFDRYVRVADPATGGVPGLGLGLSLVRTLVEAHGGRVFAASEPGRGSRFSVLLPA
jgi:signal transduction histidine kinase